LHTLDTHSIAPGINLTCINTDKFKTGCMAINLIGSLKRGAASSAALLPRVLRRGTAELPDMESIAWALDDLYGARIEPIVRKKGEMHCIGFYADFVDDRYIPGSGNVLEKTASLMGSMLLSPAMEGGLLRRDYIESEKKNLIDDIRAAINDKRGYAIDRLIEEMCAGEAFGVNRLGDEQEARDITPESLTARYREFLEDAYVEVLYCGAADSERVRDALLPMLQSLPRRADATLPATEIILSPRNGSVARITEKLDVTQGKLAIGFRMGKAMMKDLDSAAMMIFNAIYGAGVTSKLFTNVRERLALCYYAGSMVDKQKGIMIVSSGVDFGNVEIALDEIMAQLKNVQNGDITDFEFSSAKRSAITSIKATMDRPAALMDFYFDSRVTAVPYDPEELCDRVEALTPERIVEVAADIMADTVYFLEGLDSGDAGDDSGDYDSGDGGDDESGDGMGDAGDDESGDGMGDAGGIEHGGAGGFAGLNNGSASGSGSGASVLYRRNGGS